MECEEKDQKGLVQTEYFEHKQLCFILPLVTSCVKDYI